MIHLVLDLLRELGMPHVGDGSLAAANFTLGRSVHMRVFMPENPINIKLSFRTLAREHDALREAHATLGPRAPEPLGVFQKGDLWLLLTRLVSSRPVNSMDLRFTEFFDRYLEDSLGSFAADSPVSHRDAVERLVSLHPTEESIGPLERYLAAEGYAVLKDFPTIAQHGDFVRANVHHFSDDFIIFDWEDFGRISIAGFDAFVLVASLVGFDARAACEWLIEKPTRPSRLIAESIERHFQTSIRNFCRLAPILLFAFLHLKLDGIYEPPVLGRVRRGLAVALT